MSEALKPLIGAAAERALSRDEAEAAFRILFEGEATPSQIGGFLMALRTRGETVEEYAAAARVMRAKCNAVRAPDGAIDIVGTGGDDHLGEDVGDQPHRRARRIDVRAAGDVLLEQVVLDRSGDRKVRLSHRCVR